MFNNNQELADLQLAERFKEIILRSRKVSQGKIIIVKVDALRILPVFETLVKEY